MEPWSSRSRRERGRCRTASPSCTSDASTCPPPRRDAAQASASSSAGRLAKERVELSARRPRVVLPQSPWPASSRAAGSSRTRMASSSIATASVPRPCSASSHASGFTTAGSWPMAAIPRRAASMPASTPRERAVLRTSSAHRRLPGSPRDRRLGVDQSAVVAAQAKTDLAPEPARVRALRVRGNGAVEGGLGRREEPGPEHQIGDADPAPRILGVHLGEGLELEECQVPVAEAELGDRELLTWVGRVGLQPQRNPEDPASPRRARAQPGATVRAGRGALRGAGRRTGSGRSTAPRPSLRR